MFFRFNFLARRLLPLRWEYSPHKKDIAKMTDEEVNEDLEQMLDKEELMENLFHRNKA